MILPTDPLRIYLIVQVYDLFRGEMALAEECVRKFCGKIIPF